MKKSILYRVSLLLFVILFAFSAASCSSQKPKQTFAEAHDAFQTTLIRQDNDTSEVPAPPEGVFDLVSYPSKVGDLAAYVSGDPKDGQKHPMMIWIVGGWGNSIDEFPWSYAEWDNDQTGSAFWKAGVLTMYPSFRGGNGNPGYFEALFGEVDDIASAYEYAASLPYVDPERIYLGGHSTGGTRALLAAEYMDKFRSVFCFGAVDEIKYHNNSEFTFDLTSKKESYIRSPLFWLQDIKTPTFLIEGVGGNSANLENMRKKSTNENISCYLVKDADHFSTLAPITELLAQKILKDTGDTSNITLTDEELAQAMAQPPKEPMPLMVPLKCEVDGAVLELSYPVVWEAEDNSQDGVFGLYLHSNGEEDNVWDMASVYINAYTLDEPDYLLNFRAFYEESGYTVKETTISGLPCLEANGLEVQNDGNGFNNKALLIQKDNTFVEVSFYIHESYGDTAEPMFQAIADSIKLS